VSAKGRGGGSRSRIGKRDTDSGRRSLFWGEARLARNLRCVFWAKLYGLWWWHVAFSLQAILECLDYLLNGLILLVGIFGPLGVQLDS
jgi:hypothetical protein